MKIYLLSVLFLCFSFAGNCKNLKVTIRSITPNAIPAFYIYDETANGNRKLTVTLGLSGRRRNFHFMLTIKQGGLASNPILVTDEILITADDIKKGFKSFEVSLKLKPLDCLPADEQFILVMSSLNYVGKVESPFVTINAIPIPAIPSARLLEHTTIIEPYLKPAKDDSTRDIAVQLLLQGKKVNAIPQQINFFIPQNEHTASNPLLNSGLNFLVSTSLFSDNGCPVILRIPLSAKLTAVDSTQGEEHVYISASIDNIHSHKLIIRKASQKTSATGQEIPDTSRRAKNSFTYGCDNSNHNFQVTMKPDSLGGSAIVQEAKEKKTIPV